MAGKKATGDACPYEGLTATDVTCPDCGKGRLAPARGRFGPVYKCDAAARPKCKFQVSSRPIGETCGYVRVDGTVCGALMVEGTKTIPDRCSDRACPNRNPHKIAA